MSTNTTTPALNRRALLHRAIAGAAGAAIGATAVMPASARDKGGPDIFALGGRQDDDDEILALFHRWLDTCRELDGFPDDHNDEDRWDEVCDRLFGIEESVFKCRGGASGAAVKVFLHLYREFSNWVPRNEQIRLDGDECGIKPAWVASLLRDAAEAVPEIGECAAAIIHEDAALIEADMSIEWADRYGLAGTPYPHERPEWRRDLRHKRAAKRALIANTEAKTERGRAIKARHAGLEPLSDAGGAA